MKLGERLSRSPIEPGPAAAAARGPVVATGAPGHEVMVGAAGAHPSFTDAHSAGPTAPTALSSPPAAGGTSGPPSPALGVPPTAPLSLGSLANAHQPPAEAAPRSDALDLLKERAAEALFERLGTRLNDTTLSENQLHAIVRTEIDHVIDAEQVPLNRDQRTRLVAEVADDVLGHGPLQRLLDDDAVTEIMVNGPERIYVERSGLLTRAPVRFTSDAQLRRVIDRIVTRVGRRIDESSPLVDARLPDGSRVNAVIPPLAFSGSTLTIRKFSRRALGVDDLIRLQTFTPEIAAVLRACVEGRLNVIVSGGTGTGKTSLLNVLSSFIPAGERIITIEDAVELQLQQEHVVRLESRPANTEGKGEITIRDLVRNSLRMRPDRIVVGEVRGGESLDMLQAMNTGHDGSLSTVHANTPRDAIARLETLVLMAGVDLPLRAIREQIVSAVDVIVQLSRLRDGSRRITAITEVQGMEGQTVTLQDIFLFDYSAGVDAQGRFLGRTRPTGLRPRFTERLADHGIVLPPDTFGHPGGLHR